MCRFPNRKKIPITISTTGPASDRGGRGGRTGDAGGGIWVALTIFHLGVYFSWRRLGRRNIRRRVSACDVRVRAAQVTAAFEQLYDSDDKQNHWPGAVPVWPMQVVQQRKHSHGDQYCRTGKSAMTIITLVNTRLPSDEKPDAQYDQDDGPEPIHAKEPNSQVVQQEQNAQSDEDN